MVLEMKARLLLMALSASWVKGLTNRTLEPLKVLNKIFTTRSVFLLQK
jgi:hypothetical protein